MQIPPVLAASLRAAWGFNMLNASYLIYFGAGACLAKPSISEPFFLPQLY